MTILQQIEEHFITQRKTLIKMAQRRLGDFWAEDAVNDAYEAAIRYGGKKEPVASVGAYLNYILGTVIRKYESDKFPDTEIEDWMWESGELADEMRAKGVLQSVLEDLCEIEEPTRSCVYLQMIQGERIDKVSVITGCTEGSIKMACLRFRREMREKYGQE
ncbi:MAG: hypothetical protein [Caudoviricetes sp.]|nr:MAG: hypothetical protein [Caudoviricetes sp.]